MTMMMMRVKPWLYVCWRLCAVSLCLLPLFPSAPAGAEEMVDDEFLIAYRAPIFERSRQRERDDSLSKIINRVAMMSAFDDEPAPHEVEADKALRSIDGMQVLAFTEKPVEPRKPGVLINFTGITSASEAFPTGDLFLPLIADPKQPQFLVSINRFSSSGERNTMASVGFGETFGLYRFLGNREGSGLQLNLEGALFAQVDLDSPASDLINAGYSIGIPVTFRHSDNSLRCRLYHQGSHLGDEFLQSINPPELANLSYEAVELIYSREWRGLRGYGGGEYLIHKEPDALQPMIAHWGGEYRGDQPLIWNSRPIFGVDMKSWEEHDWDIGTSVKAGLEFGNAKPGQRRLRLMAEWYKGFDPYGQFYTNRVEYYGLGLSLVF